MLNLSIPGDIPEAVWRAGYRKRATAKTGYRQPTVLPFSQLFCHNHGVEFENVSSLPRTVSLACPDCVAEIRKDVRREIERGDPYKGPRKIVEGKRKTHSLFFGLKSRRVDFDFAAAKEIDNLLRGVELWPQPGAKAVNQTEGMTRAEIRVQEKGIRDRAERLRIRRLLAAIEVAQSARPEWEKVNGTSKGLTRSAIRAKLLGNGKCGPGKSRDKLRSAAGEGRARRNDRGRSIGAGLDGGAGAAGLYRGPVAGASPRPDRAVAGPEC